MSLLLWYKNDVSHISFYEKSELFNQFLQYHIEILLWDLSVKFGREDIFKQITGNESLCESSMMLVLE